MVIAGVNGINTHGETNVDVVLSALRERGLPVKDIRLPKRHFISARWGGRNDGAIVAEKTKEGDILVAHSFGAVRAWYAHRLREYSAIFLIAPAHSVNAEWYNPFAVYCFYSPKDLVVRIGSWLRFNHPFGEAGIKGYSQFGVTNIEMVSDHDDYFHGALLAQIVDRIELIAIHQLHNRTG